MTELCWKAIARVQFEGDAHAMEDTCGFAGSAAWTVDGATSLLEPLGLPGPSDPAWLAETLSLSLAEAVAEAGAGSHPSGTRGSHPSGTRGSHPSGIPSCERQGVRALLAAALTKVDDVGRRWVGEERVRFPSAAVSVAVLNEDGVEVLSLADCHVVVRLAGGGIEHVMSQLADSPADSATDSSAHSPVDSSPDSSAGVPASVPVGAPAGGPRASLPGAAAPPRSQPCSPRTRRPSAPWSGTGNAGTPKEAFGWRGAKRKPPIGPMWCNWAIPR